MAIYNTMSNGHIRAGFLLLCITGSTKESLSVNEYVSRQGLAGEWVQIPVCVTKGLILGLSLLTLLYLSRNSPKSCREKASNPLHAHIYIASCGIEYVTIWVSITLCR